MRIRLLFTLIFLSLLLIVACGPAVPGNAIEPSAGGLLPEGEAANNGDSDGTRAEIPAEGNSLFGDDVAGPATNVVPDSPPDGSAVEVDAKGIEVGFTEDGHPYRGNRRAAVVIEEFSDFQCPFCGRFAAETLPVLDENQIANGEAVLIYYDFPLTNIHPYATAAANAARCAGEQGAASYWAMHDLLFANGGQWPNGNANAVFSNYGRDLGLEMARFDGCLASNKYADEIEADLDLGRERGVRSTPSFFINGQPLIGAQPISVFDSAIAAVQQGEEIAADEPPPGQPAVAPTPAVISAEGVAATLGDPGAPVTIVEYTDYQCPFCGRHSSETMPQIVSELIETGRVYYLIKDFPLDSLHPEARQAAVAAHCAGEQEAYWEMHDAIFGLQEQWAGQGAGAQQVFLDLVADLGLDVTAYGDCAESGRYDAVVQANVEEGLSLGVRGTPFFFINGYPVSGARPYELFDYAVGLAEEGTLADAYVPPPQPEEEERPSGPVDVPVGDAFTLGDADAPIVIVEYTDYQCPFCNRHYQQTFWQIKENFIDTGQVRYVFKDFPLTSIHPQAVLAAEAARCAGDQEAYLGMHNMLFDNLEEWNGRADAADLFTGYAGQLGLDTGSFDECLNSHKHEAAVMADQEEGASLGVRGTPAFFINGYFLSGAQPYATFEEAVNNLLSEIEEGG